jgi:hypothetical protein
VYPALFPLLPLRIENRCHFFFMDQVSMSFRELGTIYQD